PVIAETEMEPVPAAPAEIDVVEAIVGEEPLEMATEPVDEPVVPPAVIEIVVDTPKVDEPVVEPESSVAEPDVVVEQAQDEINPRSQVPDAASDDKEDVAVEDAAAEENGIEPETEAEEKK